MFIIDIIKTLKVLRYWFIINILMFYSITSIEAASSNFIDDLNKINSNYLSFQSQEIVTFNCSLQNFWRRYSIDGIFAVEGWNPDNLVSLL